MKQKMSYFYSDFFLQTTELSHLKVHFLQKFYRPSYLTKKQTRVLAEGATFGYHRFLSVFRY